MTLDRKGTGGSGTRRVRFQSPEELLLQERLDAAQAIPGKAETRAKLQALHQQDKADRQLKQQQEATSRATAIAAVSQAEPTARTDRQLTGFFAYNIEGLYSNGKLDYAALKARLQAHTPGVRSPQSAGSAAGPTRPGNEHPTASSPGPAEQQQQQQPSPLSIDAGDRGMQHCVQP